MLAPICCGIFPLVYVRLQFPRSPLGVSQRHAAILTKRHTLLLAVRLARVTEAPRFVAALGGDA
jgi:hypothetical protein